jgi:YesN/AraC family two-component response regulator
LFNDLLAHIFLASEFHLEIIKVRVIELIVLLSRATIDAGANINEIFCFNDNYIKRIEQFNDIEDLSVWLTGILHRFINYSFDFTNVKHSDVVYKVIQYIKSNYTKKLSLDEIANYVYLSSSYLSTIFKEETGQSLTNYINIIRIEKSKILMLNNNLSLVEISNMCGFDDQSYFTKVFKKITGISPKVYRSSREKSFLKQ